MTRAKQTCATCGRDRDLAYFPITFGIPYTSVCGCGEVVRIERGKIEVLKTGDPAKFRAVEVF